MWIHPVLSVPVHAMGMVSGTWLLRCSECMPASSDLLLSGSRSSSRIVGSQGKIGLLVTKLPNRYPKWAHVLRPRHCLHRHQPLVWSICPYSSRGSLCGGGNGALGTFAVGVVLRARAFCSKAAAGIVQLNVTHVHLRD